MTPLDALSRDDVVPITYEYMLTGMLANQGMLPQVLVGGGTLDDLNQLAIDLWMGASPVYTRRMRRLMGIEGDGVPEIMKALQLDVGFVHQYMHVGYELRDEHYGEFWLNQCGALLDVEPFGEERVVGMCHTIEDPTFDATAYATNPRARIRPIHRPPRVPADRAPHCRWTIAIDPANEPVGPARLTERIGALPLAAVPNELDPDAPADGGRDYRGPFDPEFQLTDLSTGLLRAVAREFQMQTQLLMCSGHLALEERFGPEPALDMLEDAWVATAWIGAERVATNLRGRGHADGLVAAVLRLHPAMPLGLTVTVTAEGNRTRVLLEEEQPGLLDPAHPGWLGVLARGRARGVEAMAAAVDRRSRLRRVTTDDGQLTVELEAGDTVVEEPRAAAFIRVGALHDWKFQTR